jgi:serine protease AprX
VRKYLKKAVLVLLWGAVIQWGTLSWGMAFAENSTIPVAPQVLEDLRAQGEAEFFIVLREKGDTQKARYLESKLEKGAFVYSTLSNTAIASQKDIVEWLERQGITYRRFWIVNQILVKGDAKVLSEVLRRTDVTRVDANPRVTFIKDPEQLTTGDLLSQPTTVEWGIQRVHADDVWNTYGVKGEGIVVAEQDTGVEWTHPALIDQYRGWNGTSADHNYNWHDAIHSSSGDPCGNDSPFPCDDYNHGTHTMGTMVGDDGGANKIGVAPEAKWIACRNMDRGVGSPATYIECFEWFMAPYPIGRNPLTDGDPMKAPHVINNSWSCPPSEGCNPDTLESIVTAVHDAGIMVVASNGNSGPGCSSTYDPPAFYESSFSVGATDISDGLASFSSRGPVTYKGKTYIKPDISAPGVNIRSSVRGGLYDWKSGTSMAAPHVAGVAALLWSAYPSLKGKIALTEDLLELRAFPKDFTSCGDPVGVPNNGYGYGIVDALNAIQNPTLSSDVSLAITDNPDPVFVGGELNYTLTIRNSGPDIATGVILADTIPPEASFLSVDTTQGTCNYNGAGVLTCDIGRIGSGAFVTIDVRISVQMAGTITNAAAVSIRGNDPDLSNNSAIAVILALPVKVTLSVSGSGNGSGAVMGEGINCIMTGGVASGNCEGTFNKDMLVILTASTSPNSNSSFDGWSGCELVSGLGNTQCNVTMNTSKSVTATFTAHIGPFITGITPNPFGLGDVLTMRGVNFGTKKPTVRFGSVQGKVLTWSDNSITFSFSTGVAGTQDMVVTVNKVASNRYSCTLSAPVIQNLSNQQGLPNTQVTLSGKFFGAKKPIIRFTPVGSAFPKSARVVSSPPYNTSVSVLVPRVAPGRFEIRLQNGALISEPVTFTVLAPPAKP